VIVPTRQGEVNLPEGLACIIHERCCRHRGFAAATRTRVSHQIPPSYRIGYEDTRWQASRVP